MSMQIPGWSKLAVGSIYCIGRNYADHAKELNNAVPKEPVVFLKAPSSLRGLNDSGRLAFARESMHHEAEIVLLIDRPLTMGSAANWEDVAGLGLGLDLTRRTQQEALKKAGLPWTLAKSFEGAAIVSDVLPLAKFKQTENLQFQLTVNGNLRQRGESKNMLFSIPRILSFLLSFNNLHPGDLIFTGTPAGVNEIKLGDRFELSWIDEGVRFSGQI